MCVYKYVCVCVCVYDWATLLYNRIWYNIVNQLYSNKKGNNLVEYDKLPHILIIDDFNYWTGYFLPT